MTEVCSAQAMSSVRPPNVPQILSNGSQEEESECDDSFLENTGMEGRRVVRPLTSQNNSGNGGSSTFRTSPRCEAFVMTGEKMLLLTPKISPSYAKARKEQLPPGSVDDECNDTNGERKRGPFDDFPSLQHRVTSKHPRRFQLESAVPCSQSDHQLGNSSANAEQQTDAQGCPSTSTAGNQTDVHSSVTVHALGRGGGGSDMSAATTMQSLASEPCRMQSALTAVYTQSEPSSPAKRAGDENETPSSSASTSTPLKERLKQLDSSGGSSVLKPPPLSEIDAEAACRLAKRLYLLDGFDKSHVVKQLAKNNEFGAKVATEYLKLFNFSGLRLDAAIRLFLSHFSLIGESQERERVLAHFSRRYYECNPSVFASEDEAHSLTVAILLLNTDLHGQNLRRKMSVREFINNLSSNSGYKFKRDLLKSIYQSIKTTPIEFASDVHGSVCEDVGISRVRNGDFGSHKLRACSTLSDSSPETHVEYKSGWVMRKCVYDSDGKRTPMGRRGWRMFYASLTGMMLYLRKDDRPVNKSRGQFATFANAILVHHALAKHERNYDKRQHVFCLHTANLGQFLFETSDPNEVDSWVDALNFVAASFSSPALPAPVGSDKAFHRPLLPSAPTKLSMPEQLSEHQKKVGELEDQLAMLKEDAPHLKAKGREVQEYFFRERYLEHELERYRIYVGSLRTKLEAVTPSTSAYLLDTFNGGGSDESEAPPDPKASGNSAALKCAAGDDYDIEEGGGADKDGVDVGQADKISYREAINRSDDELSSANADYRPEE